MKKYMMCVLMLALSMSTCGPDSETSSAVRVNIFGWGPDVGGETTFVQGMPAYKQAHFARVLVTQPKEDKVVGVSISELVNRSVRVPDIPFGKGMRIELEVLNGAREVLASGATPTFDFDVDGASRTFRVMVLPTNTFAPVGAFVIDGATQERVFEQSRLDYRGVDRTAVEFFWLGRVGHSAVSTLTGKVLVVGGADELPGTAPGKIPKFRQVYQDIHMFDPETGYFSDLAIDDATSQKYPNEAGVLEDARAYHTVTPLGENRFLVAGGYISVADQSRPVGTLELIDLGAAPSQRVQVLMDDSGHPLTLTQPRGFHTATYIPETGQVAIIGGIGKTSEEIFGSIELVDVANRRVIAPQTQLAQKRTNHKVLLMSDGRLWVLGGRDADSVLSSTEFVNLDGSALRVESGPGMNTPRFGFTAAQITSALNPTVIVVGGFTSLDGAVVADYEIGVKGRAAFVSGNSWSLGTARGGHSMVLLQQTGDVVVFGGKDAAGAMVKKAERLSFEGLEVSPPFQVYSESLGEFYVARYGATTTRMSNGQVLVVGGIGLFKDSEGEQLLPLDNAEIYNPRDPVARGVLPP